MTSDPSNGYEAIAAEFIAGRGARPDVGVGVGTVREWARALRPGSSVLDLGCGPGYPIASVLVEVGLDVYGVDASPTMVEQFRTRFPAVPVECEAVETSDFFGRKFDAVIAWGLLFLLSPTAQTDVIQRVAAVLESGGRFLFTAPLQVCEWSDVMTDRRSESLGVEAYRRHLEAAGLRLDGEAEDEGGNHYYMAVKP